MSDRFVIAARLRTRVTIGAACAVLAIASSNHAFADEPLVTKASALPYVSGAPYNWTGFYAGGNLGVAWGSSNWNAGPGISGTTNLFQTIDTFDEGGSFFAGLQGGYNYMLPNRIVLGAEIDTTFPAWPTLPSGVNPFGVSIGGSSNFTSPALGAASFAETMLDSGTVRGRIGYAPGNWLFYATGGFAWTYDHHRSRRSLPARPIRRLSGGWAGPRAPASKCRLHRTGRRGRNICSPITAVTPCPSFQAHSP